MKKSFCAAAVGSNVCFTLRKRSLPEPTANGCLWPIPALDASAGLMTAMGHLQTFTDPPPNVAFRANSGRRMSAFADRLNSHGGQP